ncbi:hypothetical protein HUG10_10535 [Halorarum halophilum]|uniref:Uncharacterized protein n=1 Tax=Halorarum halophilum TaxID=2743090 RepID=A0A7D5GC31_9EURY|nr:hypothetical protein [Halobaculum halophilum]QLG27966.1 hypothetical protein HUG10_10535 [Halobaculum halophilum]
MPSDAVAARLDIIVVLLAGILGALLVLLLANHGFEEVLAGVVAGSALAWLAVAGVNERIGRGP